LILLLCANPYAFGVNSIFEKRAVVLLLSVFFTTFLLPGVGVALMKMLGLIKSFEMEDAKDRIGPYIVTGIFYLWLFKNLWSGGGAPWLYVVFTLGAALGLFLAFFINNFTKISAHATGVAGFATLALLAAFEWSGTYITLPLFGGSLQVSLWAVAVLCIVFAGLVGTARLALGAHTQLDVWRGYMAGAGSVLCAYIIL
jgi:membrane-associated phospholipid phosphatase